MGTNPGRKRLRRIQLGLESVRGTAVAATTRWRGMGEMLSDDRTIEEIEEEIGLIDGADRTLTTALLGKITLADTPLCAEQLPYLLAMAWNGPVTGVADGVGSGRVYTTPIPFDATNSPNVTNARTYTVEAGDDRAVERMPYTLATKISIKAQAGKAAQMGGELAGRFVEPHAGGFAAASIPAVGDMAASAGLVYLDAIGGTFGTTLVSGTILNFEFEAEVRWQPVYSLWGQLYPEFFKYVGHSITGKLSFEHDTIGVDARADFRAETARLLRVDLRGPTLASAGTFTHRTVRLDLPIKYTANPPLEDQDGNDIVSLSYRSRYNVTQATAGQIVCVNELASLP